MRQAFRTPGSTYRLQFSGRRFAEVRGLVSYLNSLGVTHLYASPLLQARAGSTHGYDATDPTRLDRSLGDESDFEALSQELRAAGMGLLLDIVPNHMASTPENPWWADVLEHGRSSPYAAYFDIDWRSHGAAPGQLLRPVLGDRYGRVLERGELRIGIDARGLHVAYFERRHPLDPRTYPQVLDDGGAPPRLAALAREFAGLPDRDDIEAGAVRRARATELKSRLWSLYQEEETVRAHVDAAIEKLNGRPGEPSSFDELDALLLSQAYRHVYWQLATRELNYRRFFDISDLVGVRVEDERVFEATHALVLRLVAEGKIDGLRIDHVDGLLDPAGYLRRLQERLARIAGREWRPDEPPPGFVVVEKILSGEERLPPDWPVAGTTGYEFAVALTSLFVDRGGMRQIDDVYRRFTGSEERFTDVVYRKKKQLMAQVFAGEVDELSAELAALARDDRHARDVPTQQLAQALTETTACMPVYRTYTRDLRVGERDREWTLRATREARRRLGAAAEVPLEFLRRVLWLEPGGVPEARLGERLAWIMRWQQFTGPVMAKGLEDSALYVYTRLVSLNDVGGDPGAQPIGVDQMHERLQRRRAEWPHSLNATSTHDTKRSEDVRARINVLSEIPEEWRARARRWRTLNRPLKLRERGRLVPDAREEMLLYQTLLGAWPLHDEELPAFRERLREYLRKALREAREHSSWVAPDAEYEGAVVRFADRLLDGANGFLPEFLELQETVALHGAVNALSQVVIKLVAPGVPDFYQGTELWDFSLVDPDNRRPIDFLLRRRMLEDLDSTGLHPERCAELLENWRDGRVKLLVTTRGLRLRRELPEVFSRGAYLPLAAGGRLRSRLFACAREAGGAWVIAVAPVRSVGVSTGPAIPTGAAWGTAKIPLPAAAPRAWRDVLSGAELDAQGPGTGSLPVADLLRHLPVALLRSNG